MENSKLSISVNGKGDKPLLIGNDVQILKDETKGKFITTAIMDFILYLTAVKEEVSKFFVFFNQAKCVAYNTLQATKNTVPWAEYTIKETPILAFLKNIAGEKLSLVGWF